MDFLDRLNKEQREAAEHIKGPCLVTAGAGTGKTSVLTARVANLINNGIPAENILAITFTNKAAKEMKERANKIANCELSTISTFHSFGLKIVKENAKLLGFTKKIIILDDDDVISLIKKIVKDMGHDIKQEKIRVTEIKDEISRYKNTLMSDQEINMEMAMNVTEELCPKVYYEYRDICRKKCYVDFDDLLILPIELFKKNPNVLNYYQDRFQYILIDEYQDTNVAQYEFVKILADKYKNLFVVGDANQAIYGFRMADYRNILNFTKDYPNAKEITLAQNYRSTNMILKAANSVIMNNRDRADVTLYSNNGLGTKLQHIETFSEYDEVKNVVDMVKDALKRGYQLTDIVLLYRNNFQSRMYETSLAQAGISFNVVGNSFFSKKEIKDFVAYLRLIANTYDDLALKRIINVPKRGIGNKTVQNLENDAKKQNTSIFDIIDINTKEGSFKKLIDEFIFTSTNANLIDIIDNVLNHSGLVEMYEESGDIEDRTRVQNLRDFRSIVYNYQLLNPKGTLDEFLEELGLAEDVETPAKDANGVTLMTLHRSKGLEYPVVFIVGAEESLFPGIKENIEEERRLMYVGITRAKKELYLTSAIKRVIYGETTMGPKLLFINEIDRGCINCYRN